MPRRTRRVWRIGLALLLAALAGLWLLRFRIATGFVDDRLASAQVPASYRLTRLGPFRQRMEDVRIGDPKAPDLTARRIDVTMGYGLAGPVVRAVAVEGVRLSARLDEDGLHLEALDRLFPKSGGGKITLPDLDVRLRDVMLTLATPNGTLGAALTGTGNPAGRFAGDLTVESDRLRLASCALGGARADLRLAVRDGAPHVEGPVRLASMACPNLKLGEGAVALTATASATFDRVRLGVSPKGFGGGIGPARFAGLGGSIAAEGRLGDLRARGEVTASHLALEDAAAAVAGVADSAAQTPAGPTVRRAAGAFARLLRDGEAAGDVDLAIRGEQVAVRVGRLTLTGKGGAKVSARDGAGIAWSPAGLRVDTDLASKGGALPAMRVALRQAKPGAVLTGKADLAPYAAGAARIAASALRFGWDGTRATFDGRVMLDGPVADGFVRGLDLPVDGRATRAGAVTLWPGCRTFAFRELRLSSFTISAARLPVCGRPIVALAGGRLRIDAATGPVRLEGWTGTAPVRLAAEQVRLTERGLSVAGLATRLGDGATPTRLDVAQLAGSFGRDGVAGEFAEASGAIANVPLDLSGAAGRWSFAGGALRLTGGMRVSDAQTASPRFHPLAADEVALSLADGRIAATGLLRQRGAEVAQVALAHNLSSGTGRADLDVPGIAFAPRGLQPDHLTPLTLGVVANVAGTVTGKARIDWSPTGVRSTGDFGTERMDLAAAFGPVTGIATRLHFTDLLGLVTAPNQVATIAEVNPGIAATDGTVHYQLTGNNRIAVADALFPFAGGRLHLDPATIDFSADRERRLTFRVESVDAAAFVQQLDFPNLAATGTFDGALPMVFDQSGGRIEKGYIAARKGGGTLAYVGELSTAQIGTLGKLAFDALKAIRYSALDISLDGRLDGEMVSNVRFTGVREATADQSLVTRLIRNLPFRFNIAIRAPFRGLVGSARAYMDPRLLLNQARPAATTAAEPPIQAPESGGVR